MSISTSVQQISTPIQLPQVYIDLIPNLLNWIDKKLQEHSSKAVTVASLGFKRLPQYFSQETLTNSNVIIVPEVPIPPFAELGAPEFAKILNFRAAGITFKNTYFSIPIENKRESHNAHELFHVIQWKLLGPERFLAFFAAGLMESGYRHSPLEQIAYDLQDLFEKNIAFSAEDEVSKRLLETYGSY